MKGIFLSAVCALLASMGLMLTIYCCMSLYFWLISLGLTGAVILIGLLFFVGFFITFFKMFCTEEIHFKMYMPKDKEEK
jgi:hypothetical protein